MDAQVPPKQGLASRNRKKCRKKFVVEPGLMDQEGAVYTYKNKFGKGRFVGFIQLQHLEKQQV